MTLEPDEPTLGRYSGTLISVLSIVAFALWTVLFLLWPAIGSGLVLVVCMWLLIRNGLKNADRSKSERDKDYRFVIKWLYAAYILIFVGSLGVVIPALRSLIAFGFVGAFPVGTVCVVLAFSATLRHRSRVFLILMLLGVIPVGCFFAFLYWLLTKT